MRSLRNHAAHFYLTVRGIKMANVRIQNTKECDIILNAKKEDGSIHSITVPAGMQTDGVFKRGEVMADDAMMRIALANPVVKSYFEEGYLLAPDEGSTPKRK
jgi:hypothetical protein